MRKWTKLWLAAMTVVSLNAPALSVVNAETATVDETSFEVNGQQFDLYESIYPQVEFEIGEGESIHDRIILNEDTLFASVDDALYVSNPGSNFEFVNEITGGKSYRDLSTFAWLYLIYDNGDMQIVSPAVASTDLLDTFSLEELVEAQYQDINFKLHGSYLNHYTDDIYEMYHYTKNFSPQIIADAYADIRRAEILQEQDPSNPRIQEILDDMYDSYNLLVERYDMSVSEDKDPYFEYFEGVEESSELGERESVIVEAFHKLPLDFQQRLARFGYMTHADINNIIDVGDFDLSAMAYPAREIHFSEEYEIEPVIIYHEMGHIIDYSSRVYKDPALEEYKSFSDSDEWMSIHQAEWEEEGSYYNDPSESFAQGFAAYWIKKIEGTETSDYGYENTDIADRPETEAYFEDLFAKLNIEG
ncbi:hypothetical protein [Globicatella sp. HMSC072A10]|uniref:hypothetical protein n=1 Tax=Globicatella sp. HMSC072A10 TaxID=1739315 RepID=UPI0008B6476F|nr:hypothetical protein [Globicatella sp. HMSC072A10]OFK52138.1 hypothetical protein HMPREF2811_02465 [Globicatella sp. HMSC072A10]